MQNLAPIPMNTVLVLDGDQRSALAVTRSLGKKGVTVITADTSCPTLAGSSKYSTHSEVYPDQRNEEDFVSTLLAIALKYQVDMIIPIAEVSVFTLLKRRSEFKGITIPLDTYENISLLSDKAALAKICLKLHLPIPKTFEVTPGKYIHEKNIALAYPIVLKPYKSKIYSAGKWLSTAVQYANSPEELKSLCLEEPAFRDHKFLMQEFIQGSGAGIFLLYDRGRCIAQFCHRRLREKPPSGGVSVLSKSVPMHEEMLAISKQLLDHVKWHGVAMVEFKITPEGRPYIMEVNTRLWGSLQLAIDSGVDFPYLLYRNSHQSEPSTPQTDYETGNSLRWFLGDLDRLYIVLKSANYSMQEKARNILSFCNFFSLGMRYEINRFSDIGPSIFELRSYLKSLFK